MSSHDPTDPAALAKAHADKARDRKREADDERDDMRWLMGSKRGRRIVWRQLERARLFHPVFSQNSMQMAHAEGCKNEGYYLTALCTAVCPDFFLLMMQEQRSERNDTDGTN